MNTLSGRKIEDSDVVQVLGSQDSGIILRRIWHQNVDPSALVTMLAASERTSSNGFTRLIREYALAEYLDRTWALHPLELVHENGRTTLIFEDPGGELLSKFLDSPMDIERFLRFAIHITAAVGKMHQRGLIHKDIQPTNLLLDPATEQVWLTGFGIASRLPRERQAPEPPEFIAGTLAYMAPEQTGRMNRSIDSRSDLYALGVTFYRMLTGVLPFVATDPMEWVHCHIARKPLAPDRLLARIPPTVSHIVMKLLAKTAEERYQTAVGLEQDLRYCAEQWESQQRIEPITLGRHEPTGRLLIPENLYGRAREVAALQSAFDTIVKHPTTVLILVSGYTGIGKSSVVNELHKALVPPRGLFAFGKFDQYKRDIPYATLAQAFERLIRQILAKSEAELSRWRETLLHALEPHGALIVDLVPELKLIIGEQVPVPDLPALDAQRRFQSLLRRFIGAFARPEHPLALFLDDLQWLDAATLDLLEDLLTQESVPHLLLIGAYRNNEVSPSHPLMRKLGSIKVAGTSSVEEITLGALDVQHVSQLITDALHCETDRVGDLAQLILQKTDGNPFFINQFLSTLADENLIAFDSEHSCWSWDLKRIHAKGYTDNVADLMISKLVRLPAATQQALQQLACLGNFATTDILATIHDANESELHASLVEARRQELVDLRESSYRFVHDRVHEAAYSLIPTEQRAAAHLRIGKILVAHTPPGQLDERIFEIVNQFNRASSLVTTSEEREQLAEFNLRAGKRAQASSAYVSALNYLTTGAALLTEDSWQKCRELRFTLELARAHCEFASGTIAEAEERLRSLSIRAVTTGERVAVACLQVELYQATDRSDEAVVVGLHSLRYLGVDFPARPTEDDARRAYDRIWTRLGARAIEDLINLPLMSDPDSLAAVDLLIRVAIPGHYFDSWRLFAVAVCTAVSLALERGHSEASCIAYAQLGTLATYFGQFDAGYRFGRLGCELAERPGLQRYQARTFETFGFAVPWTQHVRNGREFLFRGFELGSRMGEFSYAGYACGQLTTNYLMAGDSLIEAQEQAERGLAFVRKIGFVTIEGWLLGQLGLIRSLRGQTTRIGSFDDAVFRESDLERDLAGKPALALPECWYYIRKLQARFLAGEYMDALQAASRAQPMIEGTLSLLEVVEYHFYDALCRAAVHDSASFEDRKHHRARLTEHLAKLDIWGLHCPENFANRAALVGAEVARIEGRDFDAMRLYEQAIRSARDHAFVQNEGLAYEVAARFYSVRGFESFADAYLRNARDCYLRWGAEGKVRQLEARYPQLAVVDPRGETSAAMSPDQQLDVAAVVKASQALSSEMLLPQLIERLMTIALQNAGADRGVLILPHESDYRIEAEARANGDQIVLHYGAAAGQAVPESIIRYVMRTQESVIIGDAAKQNLFSEDPYLGLQRQRSILCLPLIRQKKLVGLLYLENALASHVFTPDRARLLELLGSQAAISLENAVLFTDLQLQVRLLQHLPVSAWTLTRDGTPDFVNQVWLEFSGQTFDFVRSHPESWMTAIHPEDRETASRAFWDGVRSEEGFAIETRSLRARDGTYRWHLQQAVVLRDAEGKVLKFVGTTTDIDDQKRIEEALRQAQGDLARINRVTTMGELAASLAHEISQPLAGIATNTDVCLRMLGHDGPNLEEVRSVVTRIGRDANRATEILRRIRSQFERRGLDREVLDVNEINQETVALLRDETARHNISVRTDLAADLPKIVGDRVQLQQVVMNLIVNSIEAIKGVDGIREMVIKSQRTENEQILVSVSDTGVGLPPQRTEQIFDAFFTTKPHGTGMGLRISRSIIESHGGRLWAMPNDGPGAIFFFSIPSAT